MNNIQIEAIANADAYLNNVCLTSYTELLSQRDDLLAALIALKTANGANNFNGWHEAFRPAIKMANDAIDKATAQ